MRKRLKLYEFRPKKKKIRIAEETFDKAVARLKMKYPEHKDDFDYIGESQNFRDIAIAFLPKNRLVIPYANKRVIIIKRHKNFYYEGEEYYPASKRPRPVYTSS